MNDFSRGDPFQLFAAVEEKEKQNGKEECKRDGFH
jgi:hypothetical protein